jgi:hypothetical protein
MKTRRELIDGLGALTDDAKESGELALAGVLLCLRGAMEMCDERELLDVCADFSRRQIERLTGEPDWGEDTIRA